jgi:uncharacterized protein (TIGR03790 family)
MAVFFAGIFLAARCAPAQSRENVLVVINESDSLSRRIGDYYVSKRSIPLKNVCRLKMTTEEKVDWNVYLQQIEEPVKAYLQRQGLSEQILYIVTTMGVPLRIAGTALEGGGAVDSELCLLYAKAKGTRFERAGIVGNPFFGKVTEKFQHPRFPLYLVTRLAGYDFEEVKGVIDHALQAHNRGKFVLDLKSNDNASGNDWLRQAAAQLPADRVVLEQTSKVLYDQTDVIAYAAWGSNDPNRKRRFTGFHWLPGAIVTEYVSTNGRTFRKPPDTWTIGTWKDRQSWFFGSPQTMTADYLHEGATGASGHVDEPFLGGTPRPNYLLPAYYQGRTLAESYYLAIPGLSWQNIVVGDPLCRLAKP